MQRYEKKGKMEKEKAKNLLPSQSLFDIHQKKLAAPSGTANYLSVSNLKVSDQQQQEPYQPHCPHTS